MKIRYSKINADPFNIVSVNEDIKINYNKAAPAFELVDDSYLIFNSMQDYNYFIYDSKLYDKDNLEIDMKTLETKLLMEDDVVMNQYLYYNKAITTVAIYKMDNGVEIIRLFREDI